MIWFRRLFVLSAALLSLAAASFGAPAADPSLDAVLAHLDQASSTFKSLTADIRKMSHTDVVNVDDADSGTILVKRFKPQRHPHPHRFDQSPAPERDHRRGEGPGVLSANQ